MEELHGLVVCGGQSSRMGKDKSLLDYHGLPQRDYLRALLTPFCNRVWISCNSSQAEMLTEDAMYIPDHEKFEGIGPMASLLSAFEKIPSASFLVVGCDYPFVEGSHLQELIASRWLANDAVCFRNPVSGYVEPLVAIYENNISLLLTENFKQNKYSLRHLLGDANAKVIQPASADFLTSVDDVAGYERARQALHP